MLEPRSSAGRVLLVSSVCCCMYLKNCTSSHISTIGLLSTAPHGRQFVLFAMQCRYTAAVAETREYHSAASYAPICYINRTLFNNVSTCNYWYAATYSFMYICTEHSLMMIITLCLYIVQPLRRANGYQKKAYEDVSFYINASDGHSSALILRQQL